MRAVGRASNAHAHPHAAAAAAAAARAEKVELTSDEIYPGLQRVEKKLLSLMEKLGKKLLQLYPHHAEADIAAAAATPKGEVEASEF